MYKKKYIQKLGKSANMKKMQLILVPENLNNYIY
jgi:hypothetical protein